MNEPLLIRHINNFVGSGYGYVPRWAFRVYGNSEWELIREMIIEWEKKGYLEMLADPETVQDNDNCVKMLNFIGADEPLPPHWISYHKIPPQWRSPSN